MKPIEVEGTIDWIQKTADHFGNIIDEKWEKRNQLIVHPGHIRWMVTALKELAEEIQKIKSDLSSRVPQPVDQGSEISGLPKERKDSQD